MNKNDIQKHIEKILKESNIEIQGENGDKENVILVISLDISEYITGFEQLFAALCYIPSREKFALLKPGLYFFDTEDENTRLKVTNEINDAIKWKVILNDDGRLDYENEFIIPYEKIDNEFMEYVKLDIVSALATLVKSLIGVSKNEE